MKKKKTHLKAKVERLTCKYKDLIDSLQERLTSRRLTEEQKIKIYFFIKREEIKNMGAADLRRAKKKYEHFYETTNHTINYLEKNYDKTKSVRSKNKLKERIMLEKYASKECKLLLKRIGSP